MARRSIELHPFYVALILAFVGLGTISAEVECGSSSGGVCRYLRAQQANEGMYSSPRHSPPESRHASTHYLPSQTEMQVSRVTTLSTSPVLLSTQESDPAAAAEVMRAQQKPRQRFYRTPRSPFTMLPRGSVYVPPGPSLGSNTVLPPPDEP